MGAGFCESETVHICLYMHYILVYTITMNTITTQEFDALIIGTGTAGETAATILRDAELSVAVADHRDYGGTCALRGCQPKKYLVVPAHAALEGAALTKRGFVAPPELHWASIQRSRAEFTAAVPESTERGFRDQGIHTFRGTCGFLEADSRGATVECGNQTIRARRVLVASGARPRPLTIPGGELARSSDDFLTLEALPRHITFVGGGYISMEFATVAAAAGSRVTVLQRGDRIMNRFDADLVEALHHQCAARGIDVVTNAEVSAIAVAGDEYTVSLADGTAITTDLVVAALGRIPNTDTLMLENTRIGASPQGIVTRETMRTDEPSVFAAGDCVASTQLSPVSDAEARIAAQNMVYDLTGGDAREAVQRPQIDLEILPSVVFTYPQLAHFGLNEAQARDRGGVRIHTGSGARWPNYRRLNEDAVLYKVMIDNETDLILGAHILAPQAGELINLLALAAQSGTTAREFREFPWAYPTYTADLKYMLQ